MLGFFIPAPPISSDFPKNNSKLKFLRVIVLLFVIIFVFLSFADIRVSIGGKGILTISPLEIWSYILALFVAGFLSVTGIKSIPLNKEHKLPIVYLIAYFAWSFICALFFFGDPFYTIQVDFKKLIPSIIFLLSLHIIIQNKKELKLVLYVFMLSGFINMALGLVQYKFGGPYPVDLSVETYEKLNLYGEKIDVFVTGFYSHPNSFAQVMIPFFVIFSIIGINNKNIFRVNNIWIINLSVLFGIVLIATASKGAILWSVGGIISGIILNRIQYKNGFWIIVTIWWTILVGIFIGAFFLINRIELNALGPLMARIDFIIASFKIFSYHPLNAIFGGGIRYWSKYSYVWTSYEFPNAHNVYLNQLLMYGVCGISFLIVFLMLVIKRVLARKYKLTGILSPYPYIGAIFSLTGSYFFEPSFSDIVQKFHLFFLISVLMLILRMEKQAL